MPFFICNVRIHQWDPTIVISQGATVLHREVVDQISNSANRLSGKQRMWANVAVHGRGTSVHPNRL
jgi:hypothetical protein